jgi:hypothetical protein
MHCLQTLKTFKRAAANAGMSDEEVDDLEDLVARNPMIGDEIVGTGGCRKVRVAGRGKGKSGGYRVITFYSGQEMPVTLITVFSKGQKDNLSKSERVALGQKVKEIVTEYRKRVVKVGKRA